MRFLIKFTHILHDFWVMMWCLYSSFWVLVCVCVVAVSPSVLAAGGGRAQLMSLSAAGWAWKRPFVGSCSTSSPCASDTHSHRGQERGMAPFRRHNCPLNWHIYRLSKLAEKNCAFGWLLYPSKLELSKSPKAKEGKKKTWSRSEAKVDRLCRTADSAFSVSESEEKKRIYSNWKDRGKENQCISTLILAWCWISFCQFFFFSCVWIFLLLDTCRGETFVGRLIWTSNNTFQQEGKESKWKCWRYAWNWWGVNLRKASRPPPAVTWKVRIFCDGCSVVF